MILAGGTFNTPQLLMLSGIGDATRWADLGLRSDRNLPGVGRNLQDRYEIGVVNRMATPWRVLDGARFTRGDKLYGEWLRRRAECTSPTEQRSRCRCGHDRNCACPICSAWRCWHDFQGYFPGYSRVIADHHDYLTWAVLKAHTNNRAGEVTLRSANPRDTPLVNFRYFEEGSDKSGEDLKAVVAGLRFVRQMTQELKRDGLIRREELPGNSVQTDEQLADYVRNNAWGHHASCSCAIGPREAGGVLDSRLRVHSVDRLRIVDASVFPRIPGFFIAGAVYMVAEKAADMILEDA